MTCRQCGEKGQQPYEIADVMKFLIDPPKPPEPAEAEDQDEGGEEFHLSASVPPDRPIAGRRAPEAAYRFAWNG